MHHKYWFILLVFFSLLITGCKEEIIDPIEDPIEDPVINETERITVDVIIHSFGVPGGEAENVTDITFDGRYLYVLANDTIIKLRKNGSEISNCSHHLDKATGITYDGRYFWVTGQSSDSLVKLDKDCTYVTNCTLPIDNSYGLTYNGRYFALTERVDHRIYQVDKSCNVVNNISIPGMQSMGGITTDGYYYYILDTLANQTLKLTGSFENFSNKTAEGSKPEGLVVIGDYFYIADSDGDKIYVINR